MYLYSFALLLFWEVGANVLFHVRGYNGDRKETRFWSAIVRVYFSGIKNFAS